MRWILEAGAVAGAIASVIGLGVLIANLIDDDEERSATIAAEKRVTHNVSLADYLAGKGEAPSPELTKEDLRENGNVFRFDIDLEGFEGSSWLLHWSRFDAATGRRLSDTDLVEQTEEFKASGKREQVTKEIWVPLPSGVDGYFVRAEVQDGDGETLKSVESPTVTLLSP